jgi:hypothetical protein
MGVLAAAVKKTGGGETRENTENQFMNQFVLAHPAVDSNSTNCATFLEMNTTFGGRCCEACAAAAVMRTSWPKVSTELV